jgi:LuxR family maltose regulon positive regulatory protein
MGDEAMGGDLRDGQQKAPVGSPSMSQSLLLAKTSVPQPHAGLVERPRLYAVLDAAVQLPVTSLTAPAGSGKTQLLASWAEHSELRVGWLTLDRMDADPLRFWTALLVALRRVVEPSEDSLLATLSPAPGTGYPASVLPALVVDALAELDEPVVIVLDDVNAIEGSPAAEGLSFLMLHLPASTRLVLSGAYLPGLPRSRLRLEGKLTSVSSRALAFNSAEAQVMLERSGITAAPEFVAELTERTEGWSAGLRLAALTGAEEGVVGDRAVLAAASAEASEYLVSEVLRHLPPEVQKFLLHTCVCERISGPLGDALTQRSDGSAVLRWLAEHNVFTVSLAEGGEWYRYHAMFATMLRERLSSPDLPAVETLNRRAAQWFADAGLPVESFDHAVRGQAWDLARETVLSSWLSMYLDGELLTLRDMLVQLPAEVGDTADAVSQVRRLVSLAIGDQGLTVAVPPTTAGPGGSVPDLVLAMEQARSRGNLDDVRAAATALLAAAADPGYPQGAATDLRALSLYELGVTEYWAGERTEAEEHLRDALAAARSGDRGYVELGCISQLVGVLTAQDRLDDALVVASEGSELARSRGWEQTAAAAELWHALGWVHYLRDQLDESDHFLDLSDEAVRTDDAAVRATIRLVRALVLSQRGQKRRALGQLKDAVRSIEQLRERHVFVDYVDAEIARLSLTLGRVSATRSALADEAKAGESVHLSVARAELLVSDSQPRAAWELLTKAVQQGEGWLNQRIQAHVLLAVLQAQELGSRSGLAVLAEAVDMAAPERMIQPMLQFGPRVDRMLEVLERRQTPHRDFITEVRSHIASSLTAAHHMRPRDSGLEEPLTAREVEVLLRLDSMATLPEIAAELYVSLNTVKAHLRSLYQKLQVHGRREAVGRAEELGLL